MLFLFKKNLCISACCRTMELIIRIKHLFNDSRTFHLIFLAANARFYSSGNLLKLTSIYKFGLSVCLYPINVKTAEPIGPNFFVGHLGTPGKVYEKSKFPIFVSIKIRSFLKILKIREIFLWKSANYFCFVFRCTQREESWKL